MAEFDGAMRDLLDGRPAEALLKLERCIALDGSFAPAFSTRAGIHVRDGNYAEALRDIDRALGLRPGHLGDLHNRAVVRTALERYAEAIEDYEAVLLEDPRSAGTWNNLAWLLATARDPAVRDGPRAVACADAAIRLARQPAWFDTLAAAWAECGDYARAVAAEEEAVRLSGPLSVGFRRRLENYRRLRAVAGRQGDHAESPE